MKKVALALALTLTLFGLEKDEFAYESSIITTQESGLITFDIPLSIYDKVQSSDLSDNAIFDASGHPMPQHIQSTIKSDTTLISTSLPFSYLPQKSQKLGEQVEVTVNNKKVKITTQEQSQNSSYIIDSSAMDKGIDYLIITSDDARYMVSVTITGSHDLKRWKYLARDERLAKLSMQETQIIKNRINIHTHATPYLLIQSEKKFNISKITAYKQQRHDLVNTPQPLTYTHTQDTINFELPNFVHLESLFFNLPNAEQMYRLKVTVKNSVDAKPRVVARGDIYTLQNGTIKKDTLSVNSYGRYYTVEAINNSYLPQKFSLEYTYEHKILQFLAQGNPPYSVVYGSHKAYVSNSDLSAFSANTKAKVTLGQTKPLNLSAITTDNTPEEEGTLLVWLALLVGVLLLSFMSYKLIKETHAKDKK